jgi:hypothetical protein
MGLVLGTRDKEETCLGCFVEDILGNFMSLKTFKVMSLKTFMVMSLKIFKFYVFEDI